MWDIHADIYGGGKHHVLNFSVSIHEQTCNGLQADARSYCFPYICPSPPLVSAEEHL